MVVDGTGLLIVENGGRPNSVANENSLTFPLPN